VVATKDIDFCQDEEMPRQWKTNQGSRGQGERASVEAVPLYSSGSSWACTFLVRLGSVDKIIDA